MHESIWYQRILRISKDTFNQNFNLIGTAIAEFEFSVLAVGFLKY